VTPEQRLQKSVKKGLQKPAISPKSPTDYDTDPNYLRMSIVVKFHLTSLTGTNNKKCLRSGAKKRYKKE
jgi:hypothetical protein